MAPTILYVDDILVAVAKPSGLPVHRSREVGAGPALLQAVRDQLGRLVFPVHRIDRAASGAVLFAFGSAEARLLQAALAAPDAEKDYLVLVRGATAEAWESRRPLTSARGVRQEAWTELERLAVLGRSSLLRARIHTGRRHQIRRHLAHEAHQVLGDTTYGKGRINRAFREQFGLSRLFLHARRVLLRHPARGDPLLIEAPLAEDLRACLARVPDLPDGLLERL